MKLYAYVQVYRGAQLVQAKNAPIDSIKNLMLECMSVKKCMVETAMLRNGDIITFKHKGLKVIVVPIDGLKNFY